jgi:hypothetical protein
LLSIGLNNKTSQIKDVKAQIEGLIKIEESQIKGKITIGETGVNVTLTNQSDGVYSVKFGEDNSQIDINNTSDYTAKDLLTLCAQHDLTMSKDKKGNNVFSVKIKGADKGKDATIGGPGKISIFPQHLLYIKETIEHLEAGKNPTTD